MKYDIELTSSNLNFAVSGTYFSIHRVYVCNVTGAEYLAHCMVFLFESDKPTINVKRRKRNGDEETIFSSEETPRDWKGIADPHAIIDSIVEDLAGEDLFAMIY